jgi:hypothetical protein
MVVSCQNHAVYINALCGQIRETEFTSGEKGVDQRLDGYMTFKKTYERWGLKDGEEKLRIGTSGGE